MKVEKPSGWTDALLIREIRAGGLSRNRAWEFIYKAWRGYYLSTVLKSGGTDEEVDEIISQVIMDVEKQVLKDDFELQGATLRTYFTESVVRAWARARKRAQQQQTEVWDPQTHASGQQDSAEETFIRQERINRMDALLLKLGEKCRTILLQHAQGYSLQEIAIELGMQEQSVKNDKLKCHRKLLDIMDEL
ncbi:MAG: sigma-70 family RNA polymerase sigma factor [Saprospiraceae bacterium]|nr:sigma-70 family RNA polymerase sigma factor [Saprospiraceae bacterium]